jgi:hypothetical protein
VKQARYKETTKAALIAMLIAGAGLGTLTACDNGPFEEAGEEIDDAVDDVEDEL